MKFRVREQPSKDAEPVVEFWLEEQRDGGIRLMGCCNNHEQPEAILDITQDGVLQLWTVAPHMGLRLSYPGGKVVVN